MTTEVMWCCVFNSWACRTYAFQWNIIVNDFYSTFTNKFLSRSFTFLNVFLHLWCAQFYDKCMQHVLTVKAI